MTVHKKLHIKYKVLDQIWWSWCYYNQEKMLYPARWKKMTVDQSKVLKNRLYRLFRFLWAIRYIWQALKFCYCYFHHVILNESLIVPWNNAILRSQLHVETKVGIMGGEIVYSFLCCSITVHYSSDLQKTTLIAEGHKAWFWQPFKKV